jgi:hypothetical protein
MRKFTKIVASTALLLLTASPVASAAQAHQRPGPNCLKAPFRIVTADASAVVYEAIGTAEYRGCAYGSRRSYPLGPTPYGSSSGGGEALSHTLSGTIVAYDESSSSGQTGEQKSFRDLIIVKNLRTGMTLHRVPTGVPTMQTPEVSEIGTGPASIIVVKADGAVAWIAPTGTGVGLRQIRAVDKSGTRVLASGPGIGRSSLTLAEGRLYWTQGDVPASAILN